MQPEVVFFIFSGCGVPSFGARVTKVREPWVCRRSAGPGQCGGSCTRDVECGQRVLCQTGFFLMRPWLPHTRNVRLDAASDPGEYPQARPIAARVVAWLLGQYPRHSPNSFSGLNTFTVGFTRYHCTSPAFAPTHQSACYQTRLQGSRYWARG